MNTLDCTSCKGHGSLKPLFEGATVGERFRMLRLNLGLARIDIERKGGISETTIRRIEEGRVSLPRMDHLQVLCKHYNVKIDDIVNYKEGALA